MGKQTIFNQRKVGLMTNSTILHLVVTKMAQWFEHHTLGKPLRLKVQY